jgi:hypothetical protein
VDNNNGQTTFVYGHDHFSPTHKDHTFGSTAPVQRDFGIVKPNGSFQRLVGVTSPVGTEVQTRLPQFNR